MDEVVRMLVLVMSGIYVLGGIASVPWYLKHGCHWLGIPFVVVFWPAVPLSDLLDILMLSSLDRELKHREYD